MSASRPRGRSRPVPSLLRGARSRRRPRRAEEEETNDDGRTVTLPLRPFGLRLSGLPPASPVWALADVDAGADVAMDNLLGYVSDLGARAFHESPAVGERFGGWDLGTVWSVGIGGDRGGDGSGESAAPIRDDADDAGDAASPSNRSDPGGSPPAPATPAGAEVSRSSDPSGPTAASAGAAVAGSAMLTLGHNATVTLRGVYWEDDPAPQELTECLVREMNEDENRVGLLERLRPLVCDAGDLIGNTCNVRVEVVSSDIPAVEVGEEKEEENGSQDVTTGENDISESETPLGESNDGVVIVDTNLRPNSTIPGDYVEAPPVPPAGGLIDVSTNTLEAIPSDSKYSGSGSIASSRSTDNGGGNGKETPLQLIIPILILALVAFFVVGLLHRRRRRKRSAMAQEDALNATEVEEEAAADETMSASVASDAYDAIAGAKGRGGSRAAAAAGAPQSTRRALDEVLDAISDAGSSFVSDSTASGTTADVSSGAHHGSVLSGLTSILGNSPSDDAKFDDRIAATGASTKPEGKVVDASPRTRKQEDFEGTYRNRSAMARLGLKKDILHMADDTHDAPKDVSGETCPSEIDFSDLNGPALGESFGVTRTISPKKNVDIMELQRTVEQRSLRARAGSRYFVSITDGIEKSPKKSGGPRKKGKNEAIVKEQRRKEDVPDTSKDLMLPVGLKRSDSVELVSRSSSDMDSEDDVDGAYA